MENINLSRHLKKYVSPEALEVISVAARLAQQHNLRLYLVGGAVRDLLLDAQATDIDLVLEGNALTIANQLADEIGSNAVIHTEFLTAKLPLPSFNLDLASARSESYPHPGALPIVRQSNISTDLRRRDFSINAMAISLNKDDCGQLLDECNGLSDLRNQLIRVLHEQSFCNDATRMWRAIRYEQRLGFHIENTTKTLIHRDIPTLHSISGERLWYEMECIFGEALPEKCLARAAELELLSFIHPYLINVKRLNSWYEQARQMSAPLKPNVGLYLALLLYVLNAKECEKVTHLLNLNKKLARILYDSAQIKSSLSALEDSTLLPSFIYHALNSYDKIAIMANLIATPSDNSRRHIQLYLDKLCYVKPILGGNDLISFGIKSGPSINAMLDQLLNARLDGQINSREDEIKLLGL